MQGTSFGILGLLAFLAISAGCASLPQTDVSPSAPPVRIEAGVDALDRHAGSFSRVDDDAMPAVRVFHARIQVPPGHELQKVRIDLRGARFIVRRSEGGRILWAVGEIAILATGSWVLEKVAGSFAPFLSPVLDCVPLPNRNYRYPSHRTWTHRKLVPVAERQWEFTATVIPGWGVLSVELRITVRSPGGGRRTVTRVIPVWPSNAKRSGNRAANG